MSGIHGVVRISTPSAQVRGPLFLSHPLLQAAPPLSPLSPSHHRPCLPRSPLPPRHAPSVLWLTLAFSCSDKVQALSRTHSSPHCLLRPRPSKEKKRRKKGRRKKDWRVPTTRIKDLLGGFEIDFKFPILGISNPETRLICWIVFSILNSLCQDTALVV